MNSRLYRKNRKGRALMEGLVLMFLFALALLMLEALMVKLLKWDAPPAWETAKTIALVILSIPLSLGLGIVGYILLRLVQVMAIVHGPELVRLLLQIPYAMYWIFEGPAHRIGVGCTQYPRQKTWKILPKWMIDRICLLAVGYTAGILTLAAFWENLAQASFYQCMLAFTLVPFAWMWFFVLVRAALDTSSESPKTV